MSRSVALALKTLKEMGCAEFKDVDATVHFIETADLLFDIFNSRHSAAKGSKKAINSDNRDDIVNKLHEISKYLLELRTMDGKLLYTTRKFV